MYASKGCQDYKKPNGKKTVDISKFLTSVGAQKLIGEENVQDENCKKFYCLLHGIDKFSEKFILFEF